MARIGAIEGLRAWLAWIVTIYHVIRVAGLDRTVPAMHISAIAASEAVNLFIIISGFVITGLVLKRREPWAPYITRRAFRIFPAYLLALAAGAATMVWAYASMDRLPALDVAKYTYDNDVQEVLASVQAAPWVHWISHLLLLQGVIPDNVLNHAQISMLGPAWSLSLEWQFYLVAPVLIWLAQRPLGALVLVAISVIAVAVFRLGIFGDYPLPSFLPGAAHLFLIGIFSRLAFDIVATLKAPPAAAAALLVGLAIIYRPAFSALFWAAFMLFILYGAQWKVGADAMVRQIGEWLFASPIARAAGARSYAVYLIHWPILQALCCIVLPNPPADGWTTLAILLAPTLLATALFSEVIYRFVERPMIRLGAKIASRGATSSGAALDDVLQTRTP